MIAVANNSVVVINNLTSRRASVIARRTNSEAMGVIKAWGTTSSNLMKANINGRGISRDSVNCVCYWDCEKGGFRSLRFENLIEVL